MATWQAFLLGVTVACTPSLIFLAVTLFHEPDQDSDRLTSR